MPLSFTEGAMEVEDGPKTPASAGSRNSARRSRSESMREEHTADITKEASSMIFPAENTSKLSANAITFNMLLSIIGTTVLGIANQMQRGGWIVAPLLLIVGCVIISEMTRLASLTIDVLQERYPDRKVEAYADFADMAFGKMGRSVSSVTSTFALLGMICGGLILISTNMQYSIPLPSLSDDEETQRQWWAAFMSVFTAIYLAVDLAPLLKASAAVGPFVCLGCVSLAWGAGGRAISALDDFPVECRNGPNGEPYWNMWPASGDGFVSVVLNIAGIASYGFYCFAVVVTVPTLKGQMEKPEEIVQASIIGYSVCTAAFVLIMVLAYWGFGNLGPLSLINGMRTDRGDVPGWWATEKPWENGVQTWDGQVFSIMVIINLVLTDAIYVPVTAACIEGFCPEFFKANWVHRAGARTMLTLFRMLVATKVRNFVVLTGLISSAFCVMNNILMPTAAFYITGTAEKVGTTPGRKAMHGAMFIFGVFCALFGTYGSLSSILSDATSDDPPSVGTFPRENPYSVSMTCYALGVEAGLVEPSTGPSVDPSNSSNTSDSTPSTVGPSTTPASISTLELYTTDIEETVLLSEVSHEATLLKDSSVDV